MKIQAIWNSKVLAESEQTLLVDGYHYFPIASLNRQYFLMSNRRSVCFWKGEASYYDIVVDGKTNLAAAWYYPQPSESAAKIKDHVAFWKGVQILSVG